ncbi:MAG: hypothetical protein WCK64_03325 [Synechococcaceae cyanobacterium ELA445]
MQSQDGEGADLQRLEGAGKIEPGLVERCPEESGMGGVGMQQANG